MRVRRAPFRLRALRLLAGTALLGAAFSAAAQPSDVAVKAAFLSKFGSYVSWPGASGSGPINLCLVGSDPFGRLLDDAVRGQHASGRPLRLLRMNNADGAGGCHVAFVQGSNPAATGAMLGKLRGKAVLTVTDARAGGPQGMIHFVLHQGRVRFHVDDAGAARSGLSISSRLLGLALSVRQRG
ncbi:MAG TPA: YfiR family protein [Allosphingosinicella sp.]|jgi:hypothetical protein